MRLLDLSPAEIAAYHSAVRAGDRRNVPGAVRASCGINTTLADIDRFLAAVTTIASGDPNAMHYQQGPTTGDYWPEGNIRGWASADRAVGASCARG
jgi:hypothetical protein